MQPLWQLKLEVKDPLIYLAEVAPSLSTEAMQTFSVKAAAAAAAKKHNFHFKYLRVLKLQQFKDFGFIRKIKTDETLLVCCCAVEPHTANIIVLVCI